MNNRSFSSRLGWRIIGIVSVIYLISFIIVGIISDYIVTHETTSSVSLVLTLCLLAVGVVGLIIVFFMCRREIRRMTRPVTVLSVSALNMAKGNFKAKLPEINSNDEMLRLRDSFVYLENSISDYIGQLKTTKSDKERSLHTGSDESAARTLLTSISTVNSSLAPSSTSKYCPGRYPFDCLKYIDTFLSNEKICNHK